MMRLLPLLFFAGVTAELVSIVLAGSYLGVISTLLLLLTGCVLGLGLIKSAGSNVIAALRSPNQDPSLEKDAAGKALALGVSGFFFLIPGFFSDIMGILLLLPPVRRWLHPKLPIYRFSTGGSQGRRSATIIEAEAVEIVGELHQPGPAPDDHGGGSERR
jgi:UPF0716 protein FxsA